jgi:hypothetical protein
MKTMPTVQIVTANKPLIQELRSLDTHNRKKKKMHVDYFRKEIREGRFTLTNQGIGVTVSNYICDGGHRLEAIELEGCPPVQFILARGLPDIAQKYVDQHSKRSLSDALTLFFDQTISNQVIAGLNVILRIGDGWKKGKFSPDELIQAFEERGEALKRVAGVEKSHHLNAAVWAALVEMLHETGDERVLAFAEQVIRGEMLRAGDPALTLRQWLSSISGATGGGTMQRERYLKTKAALQAFLDNRRLQKLYAREQY